MLDEVRAFALSQLRPPPRMALAEFIEREIYLPEGLAALPGKVKLWNYQRGICDAIDDPEIERVSVLKGARVGWTILISSTVAAFVRNEPTSILVLQPTAAAARSYMVDDLEPIFACSPTLDGILDDDADETGRNTILSRKFPGGSLRVIAAHSARSLRMLTARVLAADEVDSYELTAEGSALRLATTRTLTFKNRKLISGSSPTDEDTSTICRLYADSDQRVYELPCPSCGVFDQLHWKNIIWDDGKPETAAFRCDHCEALIDERHKPAMVAAGKWRATRPDVVGHAGFKVTALISLLPNASWPRLAAEFLAAKDDPSLLMPFVNLVLAEPWRAPGQEIDETSLQARAENISLTAIPKDALVLTSGSDIADDRIETSICAWDRGGCCYVLAHIVIWGNVLHDSTWAELDTLLKTKWRHPHGGMIGIDCAAIDSGDNTDQVYAFCFPRLHRRILAIKGMPGSRPSISVAKGKIKGGGRLFLVGVDTLKASLFNKLSNGQGIKFSDTLEPSYYEQLAAEKRITKMTRGQPVRRFVRISGRAKAEALDCLIYATAARAGAQVQLDARAEELCSQDVLPKQPLVIRSQFMGRF